MPGNVCIFTLAVSNGCPLNTQAVPPGTGRGGVTVERVKWEREKEREREKRRVTS